MSAKELETKLAKRSYEDIDDELQTYDDRTLIDLLDSKSRKVGSTAADLLSRRGKADVVIDAFFSGKIKTKAGKQRVFFFVRVLGRSCRRAREICLALLQDRNQDVVDDALFGLVFLQNRQVIEAIREAMASKSEGTEMHQRCLMAIEALEQRDPFIFSPHFHDAGNVWGLDKQRFADRIG